MTTWTPAYEMTESGPAAALVARLAALRERVAQIVGQRSANDPTAGDPLRGLYLPEEAVQHLLRPVEPAEPVLTDLDGPPQDRLAELSARLGLTELDAALLLIALAPDLDRAFEQLYGYLNDDVSRRRATVSLALDLVGARLLSPSARSRLHSTAPLARLGLLAVEEPDRPFAGRSLRVPDRVVAHLLGDDTPDAALAGHLHPLPAPLRPYDGQELFPDDEFGRFVHRLAARLAAGAPLTVYLRERHEGDGLACAAAALRLAGVPALHFTGPEDHVADLLREARLSGQAVIVPSLPEQPAKLGPAENQHAVLISAVGRALS